ncbi:GntR family transcriptional regulator [Streptomyces kanamyceticus]|uniref:UTRA domain-containing protein n=1 Tax=Streptomyces kanamyceticus TaxID=1967 RepID=A0A5J6GCL3_STRKN|nr:UTRA domain-containing protein [Streptomyces kanamyceticus]QEU91678.1 UTRA domain-containing protein [Streptomyces kanamyceticus]
MSESMWVSTSMPYLTPRESGQPDAWGVEAAARGGKGSQHITYAGEVPAPEDVAALLHLPASETVVVRRRIIQLDGEPIELTDTYYPAHIARGTRLAEKGKIPGGAVTLLARLGYTGVRVREDVIARMPDATERQTLNLAPDEPILQLSRVTLDADDRPLQVDKMAMPAHRQRLRYEIRIG